MVPYAKQFASFFPYQVLSVFEIANKMPELHPSDAECLIIYDLCVIVVDIGSGSCISNSSYNTIVTSVAGNKLWNLSLPLN